MRAVTKTGKPRNSGMFQLGQSGNPSGRPKSDATVTELARAHTVEAMETLVEIAGNKKASWSARVSAASAIIDRGWGKPVQAVVATNVPSYPEYLDMIADLEAEEEAKEKAKEEAENAWFIDITALPVCAKKSLEELLGDI